MEKQKDYLEYVEETEMEQIQQENGLEEDEILLPDFLTVEPVEEEDIEFIMLPAGKYEMLIRDSEKLAAVTRYVCSDNPQFKGVKALLEVQE